MELDADTFLVAVYCVIDDLYHETFAAHKPVRPGVEPEMRDSEVLTVVVLTQWQQSRSDSAFLGYVRQHWRAYFPRVLSQSAFNRRARDLLGVLCALGPSHKRGGRVGPTGPLSHQGNKPVGGLLWHYKDVDDLVAPKEPPDDHRTTACPDPADPVHDHGGRRRAGHGLRATALEADRCGFCASTCVRLAG